MNSDSVAGFLVCLVGSIAFAFAFAPLRKHDCKDGFFVQWVQCAVFFVFGLGINIVRGFPPFDPIALIGGVLFASGNIAGVPIIQNIGIGIGMLIFGSVQVTVGWCVARFGMFGTKPQTVFHNTMNVFGLILTLVSGFMITFVKSEPHTAQNDCSDSEKKNENALIEEVDKSSNPKNLEIFRKKLFFIGLSVFLGVLHGLMLTPIVYILDNFPEKSQNVLDYLFAHFCSVFACSTFYFVIYCVLKRNRPFISPKLVLPSVCFGISCSIGMILFFVSNRLLPQTVNFPIAARLPTTIALLADVFLFKTIKGRNNLIFMTASILVALTGVVLIALSNQQL